MTPTTLARLAGVLGGLCWVARAVLDGGGSGSEALVNGLHWGGLALIAIAVLAIGAGLVSGILALRVVVALCLAALVWSLLEFLRSQYADNAVDGVFGALLAAYCLLGLRRHRSPATTPPRERTTGSHAA